MLVLFSLPVSTHGRAVHVHAGSRHPRARQSVQSRAVHALTRVAICGSRTGTPRMPRGAVVFARDGASGLHVAFCGSALIDRACGGTRVGAQTWTTGPSGFESVNVAIDGAHDRARVGVHCSRMADVHRMPGEMFSAPLARGGATPETIIHTVLCQARQSNASGRRSK